MGKYVNDKAFEAAIRKRPSLADYPTGGAEYNALYNLVSEYEQEKRKQKE